MSLEISLFDIETGLRDLYAMREEARENYEASLRDNSNSEIRADFLVQIHVLDQSIRDYIGAEIRKADGTADFILMLDRLCHEPRERKGAQQRCEIDREIDRLKERRDRMREILRHVKDAVIFVMQGMSWKAGKPRKIEGVRHTLSLQGNGGLQPVEITDESLVPDEYCRVTVTLPLTVWTTICAAMPVREIATGGKTEISRSAIAEALNKPCRNCDGSGKHVCLHVIANENDMSCPDCDDDGYDGPCSECGGSGKQGVPGARLAPRSDSLVIR